MWKRAKLPYFKGSGITYVLVSVTTYSRRFTSVQQEFSYKKIVIGNS